MTIGQNAEDQSRDSIGRFDKKTGAAPESVDLGPGDRGRGGPDWVVPGADSRRRAPEMPRPRAATSQAAHDSWLLPRNPDYTPPVIEPRESETPLLDRAKARVEGSRFARFFRGR